MWPDLAIYWTLGNFSKPVAIISLSKSLTFLGNFCEGVKIVQSFLGKFYRHFATFDWSHCFWTEKFFYFQANHFRHFFHVHVVVVVVIVVVLFYLAPARLVSWSDGLLPKALLCELTRITIRFPVQRRRKLCKVIVRSTSC